MITKEKILETLAQHAPAEIISGVVVNGAQIGFALESQDDALRLTCEKAVFALPGVEKVTAVLTGVTGKITVENKNTPALDRKQSVAGVKKIIAVAAGKGGVGKSTVTVNLAVAAAAQGLKVGIVDADIYGPSLPLMLGISEKPELVDGKILPIERSGVGCASIGFLVDANSATIWRGPMATKALHQLMIGVAWKDIDVLFIDMPPGTGDIQLSLAQNYKIDGTILVSTPQEVALADVRKAAQMFSRVNIPVLGIIENMAYFEDAAGNKNFIFGQGGAKKFAGNAGIKFLGEVPLKTEIRESGDNGKPLNLEAFQAIFKQLDL